MQISVECRGVAQLGRALVSGTRGREFESRRPDQIENAEEPLVMAVLFLLPIVIVLLTINMQKTAATVLSVAAVIF